MRPSVNPRRDFPQGLGPPNVLTIPVESLGTVGLDLTTVTGATMSVRKPDGTLVSWEASFAPAPSQEVSAATGSSVSPIVLTVPSTASFAATVDGPVSATVADVGGNDAANGRWYVAVLSSTTIALYADEQLTEPSTGDGTYTSGGTVTPNAIASVTHAMSAPSSSAPLGDLDQLGDYSCAITLAVPGGAVPCSPAFLRVLSDFTNPQD